jgi:hypothetical protein
VGFLRSIGARLRGEPAEEPDPTKALYVHLAFDGGILVIRGGTGEQVWVDRAGLDRELERTKEEGGTLIYSRDQGDTDPPEEVTRTFERIVSYRLPIMLLEKPHPEALVPPDRRRNMLRE